MSEIEYDGYLWRINAQGYYYSTGKGTLHRYVAEKVYGDISGLDVHHIDGNKLNNDPNNLQPLSRQEHLRIHYGERGMPKRKPKGEREFSCDCCGEVVVRKQKSHRGVYCKSCQYHRAEEKRKTTRTCSHCGKSFKSRMGTLCSQRCVNLATNGGQNRLQSTCRKYA